MTPPWSARPRELLPPLQPSPADAVDALPVTHYSESEGEAFVAAILDSSVACPGTRMPFDSEVTALFHIAPTLARYALLRFRVAVSSHAVTFYHGAFGKLRAPTYVVYVTAHRSFLYRYAGNRKRVVSVRVPEALAFVDRCKSRGEVELLLQAAGIEPNPGPDVGAICRGVLVGAAMHTLYTGPALPVVSFAAAVGVEVLISPPMRTVYANVAEEAASYVWAVSRIARNALTHALNGNTSLAERKLLNKRAFNFDPSDPFTWKFDQNEAIAYVKSLSTNAFVASHGPAWVVEKLLMRRGVSLSKAFLMIKERYATKEELGEIGKHVPNADRTLPAEVPDDLPLGLGHKIVSDSLNARDRRTLRRVTKQSKLFSLMPDLGVTSSVSASVDGLSKGISSHGESISTGFASLSAGHVNAAAILGSSVSEATSTLKQAVENLTKSFDSGISTLSSRLNNVQVYHNLGSVTRESMPELAKTYLNLLLDVMPMVVSDDRMVALAVQASLIARHGWLTTALVDAIVFTTKQLMQWISGVTKQGSSDRVDEPILLTMYNVVYALVFQGLPTSTPGNLKDRLVTLNSLATLVKNANSLFTFMVEAFKSVVDWIYETVTGFPYFNAEEKALLFKMAEVDAKATELLKKNGVPSLEDLDALLKLRAEGDRLVALALQCPSLEKQTFRFKRMMDAISTFHSNVAFDAEMNAGHTAPVIIRVFGSGGQGKTTFVDYLTAALWARRKWPSETPAMSQVQYEYGVNFQPKIKPYSRVLIIDDPFVVQNPEVIQQVFAEVIQQGNSRPKKREAADLASKENQYEHFQLVVILDMGARSDVPINNDFAFARRMTGGQYQLTCSKKFQKPDGTLDRNKFTVQDLNDVWRFEAAADGQVINFWQVVAYVDEALSAFVAGHAKTRKDLDMVAALAIDDKTEAPKLSLPTSFINPSAPPRDSDEYVKEVADLLKAGVSKQVRFTDLEVERIDTQVNIGAKAIQNFGATLSKETLAQYTTSELSQELDYHIDANDHLKSVIEYIQETVPKGKQAESSRIADPKVMFEGVVQAGPCLFKDGQCTEHGKRCASRFEEPKKLSVWEAISAFAAKFNVRSWLSSFSTKLQEYGWLAPAVPTILGSIAGYLASRVVIHGVSLIFSSVLGSFIDAAVAKQAYSTTYARIPAKNGAKLGYNRQMHLTQYKEGSDEWLSNKIHFNTTPIIVPAMVGTLHAQSGHATCLGANLHVTTKHQFLDYPLVGKIALLGQFACTYELRRFELPKPGEMAAINTALSVVWWAEVPGRDLAILVTPKSGMIFPSIVKYVASEETPISQLLDCALVMSAQSEVELDDQTLQVVKCSTPPHYLHGAGDAISIDHYDVDGSPIGVSIRCPERTIDGSCGRLWFTRNTRTGKGHKKIFAVHAGYDEDGHCAIGAPLCSEDVQDFFAMFRGSVSLEMSSREDVIANGGSIDAKVVAVGTLAPKESANQNLKNPIKRSPAFSILSGVEVIDPVTQQCVLVPPPTRIPVDLRKPVRALAKMPLNTAPWSDQMISDYELAAEYTATKLIAQLDQAFVDRLYVPTLDHVLNGDPAVAAPGIDVSTSVGYGIAGPGKTEVVERGEDGLLHLKEKYIPEYEAIVADLAQGLVPLCLVVDNGKAELRPVNKAPRNTSCYQALVVFAVKQLLYWVPTLMKYGRIRNNTLYGVDLNSVEGRRVYKILSRHPYKLEGDYSNYDASIRPEQAEIVGRKILAPLADFLRKHGAMPYSNEAVLAALRTQTLTFHIFGSTVYLRYFGNTSGGFLTTPFNCMVGATNQAYVWLRFHGETGRSGEVWTDFEEHVDFEVYGDDYAGCTDIVEYDNFVTSSKVGELGQTVTPTTKGASFTAHVDRTTILKRTPVVRGNSVSWVLPLEVLAEIHAFVRDCSVNINVATRINMEAALREWYHYGKQTYTAIKTEFNSFLAQRSCPPILLTYEELDKSFKSAGEFITAFGVTKQSSLARHFLLPPTHVIKQSTALSALNRCVQGLALNKCEECTPPTSHALALACPYKRAADHVTSTVTPIGEVRGNDAPIVSTTALTSFNDDTAVLAAAPPQVTPAAISRTDPYPDQGMREVLSRQYRVADVSWPTSATAGTLLFTGRFPELLFTVPNIQDKLKSFRYLRAGVKVSLRVNSTGFAGGTLMIQYIPFYDPVAAGAWRHKFWPLAQTGPMLMSASRADTLEVTIPWVAPFQYRDLRSADNPGMIGSLFVYVLNPLVFSNSGAPSALSVSIFAAFDDPEVAGPDINGAPTAVSSIKKQSGEALVKTVKGVISGVARATSTVTGIVKPFASVLGLPFLNKPTSLAANTPTTPMPARGMVNASGLDMSAVLALDPEAKVSVSSSIFGGSNAQPSWKEVLAVPSLIVIDSFTQAAAADTLVASWPVRPNFAKTIAMNKYAPGNMAYYSQFFKRWRGGINYLIHFACPSNVTARVRVSFLPNVSATTAPPENQAGDIISKVVSITGDTVLMFPIEYLGDTYLKKCQSLSVVDSTNSNAVGRVTISVLNEVVSVNTAAVTPVYVTVWMAAAENFVFSMVDDFPADWAPDFTSGVTKQTSLRELFSKGTPNGMVPTVLLQEEGIVTPEKFTGPLDPLHRFVPYVSDFVITANGDSVRTQPITGTFMWLMLLPFLGWRGSLRYKLIRGSYTGSDYYFVGWTPDDHSTTLSSGFQGFGANSVAEFECPYYDYYAWRETYPIMTVAPRDDFKVVGAGTGNFAIGYAVGDDFSLGPLYGPPILKYTPSPTPVRAGFEDA